MKLDDNIKKNIDKYFDSVTAEELYNILTEEFEFPVIDDDNEETDLNNNNTN